MGRRAGCTYGADGPTREAVRRTRGRDTREGSTIVLAVWWVCTARLATVIDAGGALTDMTENERRSEDVVTRDDVVVRLAAVVSLIGIFLLFLLAINP